MVEPQNSGDVDQNSGVDQVKVNLVGASGEASDATGRGILFDIPTRRIMG
jgi:hypothetical protein